MSAPDIRPGDAKLVRALASLARHSPQDKRAEHLAQPAEDLAARLQVHAEPAGMVVTDLEQWGVHDG